MINKKKSWNCFQEIYNENLSWRNSWEQLITFHKKIAPDINWKKIEKIDFSSEEPSILKWATTILNDRSLPSDLVALNFIIGVDEDYDVEDLVYFYVNGSDAFALTEMEWARSPNFRPDPDFESNSLTEMFNTLKKKGSDEDAKLIIFYAAAFLFRNIISNKLDLKNIRTNLLKIFAVFSFIDNDLAIDLPRIVNSKYKLDFFSNYKYHKEVFNLLDWELDYLEYDKGELAKYDSFLPGAYLEWCKIKNGNELLNLYSNEDYFFIKTDYDDNSIIRSRAGKILIFHQSKDANFSCGILLNGDDDPPVMYSDFEEKEWIQHSEKFSDFIYCQIFDWKYRVKIGSDRYPFIKKHEIYNLKFKKEVLKILKNEFQESKNTKFFIKKKNYSVARFFSDEGHIMCKNYTPGKNGCLIVMSKNMVLLKKLKSRVSKLLSAHIIENN